jgi:hypothetical protein
MTRDKLKGRRLIGVFLLGCVLFNYPILSLFNLKAYLFGIPILFVYLFTAWAGLIGLISLVTLPEEKGRIRPDSRKGPS